MNVLVTGCGGDIGQSIGKILKEISFVKKVIGCDISNKTPSKFIYDNLLDSVPCSDNDYLANLELIIKENNIDLIIPISEPEIRFFATKEIYFIKSCKVLMANKKSTQIGFDKFKTIEFLKFHNFPYPKTLLLENSFADSDKLKLPAIIKSRCGSGSKNILIIESRDEIIFYQNKLNDFIVQEKIQGENNEFTCGLYRSGLGETRVIVINRVLTDSYTGFGRVERHEQIEEFLFQIAQKLELVGSINVQLKFWNNTPYLFEINPRFSSTVRFRDLMGYRDLLWSIQDLFGMSIDEYLSVPHGIKFYKGYTEYLE